MSPIFQKHENGVITIDAGYIRQGFAASHLILERGHAVFVEAGTSHSVRDFLEILENEEIPRENVDYVMVTHVHLDHAGGAGALIRELPNAMLVVHPKGARHMIDPTRLVQGTTAVYGEEKMQSLYGEIIPIPKERVIIAEDNMRLDFQGRPFYFFDGPGHARHHYCVFDERFGNFFSGDNFGISYRELDNRNGPFIFPSTTPVQFEPQLMHQTLNRIMEQKPKNAYLTHYGRVSELQALADDLRRRLDLFVDLAESLRNREESRVNELEKGIRKILLSELENHECRLELEQIDDLLQYDYVLNAQGIDTWLKRSSRVS